MAISSAMIAVRLDEQLRKQADAVLDELGLSMSEAVRVFLTKLVSEQGMPFEMRVSPKKAKQEIIEIKQSASFETAT